MKTAEKQKAIFKTFSPKKSDVKHLWLLVDVKDKPLGRVANKITDLLRGKGKTLFSKHQDCGDYVVVINAAQVKLTGKKDLQKEYNWHTRYPNGLKTTTPNKLRQTNPAKIVEHAVAGMIPNNKNKKLLMKRLKVYAGAEHDLSAQNPQSIQL
jgi:large subunit ribosomal protein L13